MNAQRSILHIIGAIVAGGAEVFVTNLACAQAAQNSEITVFSLSCKIDSVGRSLREKLNDSGVKFVSGPTEDVRLRSVLALRKQLNSHSYDIVHLHTPNTELAFALASCIANWKPLVARTIHSTRALTNPVLLIAYKKNGVPVSVACGAAVKKSDWLKNMNVIVIENGVDFSWPIQTKKISALYKESLGFDPGKRHFVSIGSMRGSSPASADKAHDVLFRAWAQAALFNRAILHVVGDGPLRSELESLVAEDTSVEFHGIKSNVIEYLLASDFFVMPSRKEGLPIAGIEGMGAGLTCLFSNIPELVDLDNSSSRRFEVNDIAGLARLLQEACDDRVWPRLEEIENFRARYGIAGTAEQYEHYYDLLVKR